MPAYNSTDESLLAPEHNTPELSEYEAAVAELKAAEARVQALKPHEEEQSKREGWHSEGLWQPPRLIRGEMAEVRYYITIIIHMQIAVRDCSWSLISEVTDYDKDREVSWSELFYDLIFVTAVGPTPEINVFK